MDRILLKYMIMLVMSYDVTGKLEEQQILIMRKVGIIKKIQGKVVKVVIFKV